MIEIMTPTEFEEKWGEPVDVHRKIKGDILSAKDCDTLKVAFYLERQRCAAEGN